MGLYRSGRPLLFLSEGSDPSPDICFEIALKQGDAAGMEGLQLSEPAPGFLIDAGSGKVTAPDAHRAGLKEVAFEVLFRRDAGGGLCPGEGIDGEGSRQRLQAGNEGVAGDDAAKIVCRFGEPQMMKLGELLPRQGVAGGAGGNQLPGQVRMGQVMAEHLDQHVASLTVPGEEERPTAVRMLQIVEAGITDVVLI